MQIPDDRKRSWYEGYCEDSPCVLSEGPYHDRKDFLVRLKDRGLCGVEFVVSDDHARLKKALAEVLTDAAWQRCYVHFLRNALDDLPRKADDDCLQELRWLYDRRDLAEAQRDLAAWLTKWSTKYPKLTDWVEDPIGETLIFDRLPRAHHKL